MSSSRFCILASRYAIVMFIFYIRYVISCNSSCQLFTHMGGLTWCYFSHGHHLCRVSPSRGARNVATIFVFCTLFSGLLCPEKSWLELNIFNGKPASMMVNFGTYLGCHGNEALVPQMRKCVSIFGVFLYIFI